MAAVTTEKKLMEQGKKFGVEKDEDFKIAVKMFVRIEKKIDKMFKTLDEEGYTVCKTYVKGRENQAAHPLLQEVPKYTDCANRILATINNIYVTRGQVKPEKDELDEFRLNA